MRFFFFLLLILSIKSTFANFDLSINTNARSWPSIAGSGGIGLGYNLGLWGEIDKIDPMYGMLRFEARADSSIVVNSTDMRVSFYPISFLALGAGRSELNSNFEEFVFFNCTKVRCKGDLDKDYLFGRAIVGAKGFVASFFYSYSRNSYNDPSGNNLPVGEYTSVNTVNPGFDSSTLRSYFLGYTQGKDSYGFFSERLEFHESDQVSELNAFVYRNEKEKWRYTYGLGSQHSSVAKPQMTIFFDITYEFFANNALF